MGGRGGGGLGFFPPFTANLYSELAGDLRDVTTLKARACKLVFRGHAAAVGFGDRRCAVGRTAGYFIGGHLPLKRVRQADDDHAVMQKRRYHRQDSGFLSAMLRGRPCKYRAHFADKRARHPQRSGLIQKITHLRGEYAEMPPIMSPAETVRAALF